MWLAQRISKAGHHSYCLHCITETAGKTVNSFVFLTVWDTGYFTSEYYTTVAKILLFFFQRGKKRWRKLFVAVATAAKVQTCLKKIKSSDDCQL